MESASYSLNFSKLFYSLLEEENWFDKKYNPAIIFLTDEEGSIVTVHESGPLPDTMLQFFTEVDQAIRDGVTTYENETFQMLSTKVTIKIKTTNWNGNIGMVTEKLRYSNVEITSFLFGFKQSIPYVIKLMDVEKKNKSYITMGNVDFKAAQILKETEFTNNFNKFAKRFLRSLYEYSHYEGEITLLLMDELREIYVPVASTGGLPLIAKEDYKIAANSLNSIFKAVKENGLSVITEKDIGNKLLFTAQDNFSDYILLPIIYRGNGIGVIMYLVREGNCDLKSIEEMTQLTNTLSPWFKRLLDHEGMILEKTRKELLLKVNRKFHSSMDVNAILEEILFALHEAYPMANIDLLLSHDWHVSPHLPIKPLIFTKETEEDLAALTYLTGKIHVENQLLEKTVVLYVPLKGKQGVYGVFQMHYGENKGFLESELDFIQVLADTGGNAIENAELYQQSQQHISNLQLINQTSHQLNENLNLTEITQFMVNKIISTFSASEAGFLMFEDLVYSHNRVMEGSSSFFYTKTSESELEPILSKIKNQQEELFIGDCQKDTLFTFSNYYSIMGLPMIQNKKVIGAVIVLGKDPYAFSFETYKLFKSLVHHSTLAFVNSLLHEELKQLVITDYLTKLSTREYMDQIISESLNKDGYGAFILLDIDHFKQINDKFGHQTGDEVIIQVATIIMNNVNTEKCCTARWGGEELAIYLPNMSMAEGVKVAEAIKMQVKEETIPKVTVSCGVSSWSAEASNSSLSRLFNDADTAMYKAKQFGRDSVVY